MATEKEARRHYRERGRKEGRLYKRYCTVMLYDPSGGLINQLYTNLAAIMLARATNAELVLAPALHRDSFNSHMTETVWHAAPSESLLDVQAIKDYWRDRGLLIHTVREGGGSTVSMCVC